VDKFQLAMQRLYLRRLSYRKSALHPYRNLTYLLLGVCLLSLSLPTRSLSDFSLQTEKLSSDTWSASGIHVNLAQLEQSLHLQLIIAEFNHQALTGSVSGIEFQCDEIMQVDDGYFCKRGKLSIAESPYGAQQADVELSYVDSEQFEVRLDSLKLAEGEIKLILKMTQAGWQLSLDGKNLHIDQLMVLLPIDFLPPGWDVAGRLSVKSQLSGATSILEQLDITVDFKQLNYTDQEGLQVAENGSGKLQVRANLTESNWFGSTRLRLAQGQVYSDPYYVDLTESPFTLAIRGGWLPQQNQLQLKKANIQLLPAIELEGAGQIDLTNLEIQDANISFVTEHLDELYKTLIQPMVIGSMTDELSVSGGLQGKVGISQGGLELIRTEFKSVDIDDMRGLFALNDLHGLLAWSKQGNAEASQFKVQSGQLYQIPYGPLNVDLQLLPNGLSLLKPLDVSLLGGQIIIDRLESKNLFQGNPEWETGAEVSNLSLEELSKAFNWPILSGELNGKLPTMHYHDESLNFGGALQVDVFGGQIEVQQLKIKQPLGRVPELFATAIMQGLDLEQITHTFSFGHVEGGLRGEINDLHLMNWEPVAFHAQFNSPEDDDLPHRISQRAVDNLTSIGNGMGGRLQNTFLGIFKEFRYNRIELQARLDGDIAELGGIDHPDGGYYLVKGAGLPRIDVIARNRRVAWKTLVERLKNIRVEGMKVH
jgi:hypothetical protein